MALVRGAAFAVSLLSAACLSARAAGSGRECVAASTKTDKFDCSKSGCCKDDSLTCYLKDPNYGECLKDCKKGPHDDDPKANRTAWSCTTVEKDGLSGELVIKEYGQCGGMLSGQGMTPYDGPTTCQVGCKCVNQSVWISTCLPKKNEVPCGSMEAIRIGKALVTAEFKINSIVEGRCKESGKVCDGLHDPGEWHKAKIDRIHEDGTYRLAWKSVHFATHSRVALKDIRHVDNSKSLDERIDDEIAELEKGGDASLRDDGLGVLEDMEDDDADADEKADEEPEEVTTTPKKTDKKDKNWAYGEDDAAEDDEKEVSIKAAATGVIVESRPSSVPARGLAFLSAGFVVTAMVGLVLKRRSIQKLAQYTAMQRGAHIQLHESELEVFADGADEA